MDGKARLVLLIEEDGRLARLLSDSLDSAHIACRCALRAESVAAAVAWRPDLVVLDAGSYRMEGLSALMALRGDPRTSRIPVIVLSGNTERRAVATALARGASGYWALHGGAGELFGDRVRAWLGTHPGDWPSKTTLAS